MLENRIRRSGSAARTVVAQSCLFTLACVAGLASACTVRRVTEPPRTANEQFLISYAAIQAVARLAVEPIRGRKVYLDATYFNSIDQQFIIGEIRERMISHGVRLVSEPRDADVIVEARSGGVGIDRRETILGIPSLPIPVPGAGTLSTPELAIFKDAQQTGEASFALFAFERESGEFIYATGPAVGATNYQDVSILGLRLIRRREDLPSGEVSE